MRIAFNAIGFATAIYCISASHENVTEDIKIRSNYKSTQSYLSEDDSYFMNDNGHYLPLDYSELDSNDKLDNDMYQDENLHTSRQRKLNKAKKMQCIPWNGEYDIDGVQLCPPLPTSGPWGLVRCAYTRARRFHEPKVSEVKNMQRLVNSLKEADINTTLTTANKLGLRACRVKKYTDDKVRDSYLIISTHPRATGYSGPGIFYREFNASNLFLHGLHVGSDGYSQSLPKVFDRTNAQALIINLQPKGLAEKRAKCYRGKISNAPHSTNNLSWNAFTAFNNIFPGIVNMHVHGKKRPGMIITNGLSRNVGKDSLLYAFNSEVFQATRNRLDKDKFSSCAPGTLLSKRKKCQLRQTWVQLRKQCGSTAPNCRTGSKNNNNIIGFELGYNLVSKPDFMIRIFTGLEKNYLPYRNSSEVKDNSLDSATSKNSTTRKSSLRLPV